MCVRVHGQLGSGFCRVMRTLISENQGAHPPPGAFGLLEASSTVAERDDRPSCPWSAEVVVFLIWLNWRGTLG